MGALVAGVSTTFAGAHCSTNEGGGPAFVHRRHIGRLVVTHRGHDSFMAWTYILECADNSYYVGSTIDLERRLGEHNEGNGSTYTRRRGRRPVTLVWCAQFGSVKDAFYYEKQIQGWSRAKREALIAGRVELLPGLARGRCRPPKA